MAAIVYQKNKKTGVIYVYESISHWDKKKQQSRSVRKCIGKLHPETNEVIPTKKKKPNPRREVKPGPVPTTQLARKYYGATYLLDQIAEKINIKDDLKTCFPDSYKKILSIAYYLILEDRNPLSRFPKFNATHKHPYGSAISSQRSSELFASISEEEKGCFFKLQAKRRTEKEFWFYDTTSISSYSRTLKQAKYGFNKDHDHLEQINLALLFGQESKLPFYYRKLAGNITDVKTVRKLIGDLSFFEFDHIKLAMDRGFYSAQNINHLYQHHLKFLIAAKTSLKIVRTKIDEIGEELHSWKNYHNDYELYANSIPITWDYEQHRPYKKDTIKGSRRMYLHLYYSPKNALEHEQTFNRKLMQLQTELLEGKRDPRNESAYERYFETHKTPVRGIKIIPKDDAINSAKKYYGYFCLMSNTVKDPIEALQIYRNKDMIEKAFGDIKDRLQMKRLEVSSELSLEGKLFVEFIALILLSYVKNQMQKKKLFEKHTMQGIFDELDVIECFEQPGQKLQVGEMTVKQKELYEMLQVEPPISLQ